MHPSTIRVLTSKGDDLVADLSGLLDELPTGDGTENSPIIERWNFTSCSIILCCDVRSYRREDAWLQELDNLQLDSWPIPQGGFYGSFMLFLLHMNRARWIQNDEATHEIVNSFFIPNPSVN